MSAWGHFRRCASEAAIGNIVFGSDAGGELVGIEPRQVVQPARRPQVVDVEELVVGHARIDRVDVVNVVAKVLTSPPPPGGAKCPAAGRGRVRSANAGCCSACRHGPLRHHLSLAARCDDGVVLRSVTLGLVLSVLAAACALVEGGGWVDDERDLLPPTHRGMGDCRQRAGGGPPGPSLDVDRKCSSINVRLDAGGGSVTGTTCRGVLMVALSRSRCHRHDPVPGAGYEPASRTCGAERHYLRRRTPGGVQPASRRPGRPLS